MLQVHIFRLMFCIIIFLVAITIIVFISKAKHEDLKLQNNKLQKQYMDEVDHLQNNIKDLQEQLKVAEMDKETAVEGLKVTVFNS